MKTNIGIINALIRITLGITMLSWITSKMVWRPYRESYLLVAMVAAMKIAEGIVRYCPLTALMHQYQKQQADESAQNEEQPFTVNPS